MPKWLFMLGLVGRELWLRVAIYSFGGVATALAAVVFAPWVPEDFALSIGTGAVDQILSILATSMLTVATFSLTTLVAAYTAVANTGTPRAAVLLVSQGGGQGALATFIGAFVYAVVGIFALQTGYYGAQGRVIVFFVTVGVLAAVVVGLLHWINRLSKLARVDEAIDRVTSAVEHALGSRLAVRAGDQQPPERPGVAVMTEEVGHVRNIDVGKLQDRAAELGVTVEVTAPPGVLAHAAQPLLRYSGRANLDTEAVAGLRSCWIIGERRTFDQDPRYGLIVLGGIAAKALSPGVNDPGTALDVISAAVRVLTKWTRGAPELQTETFPNVHFQPLAAADLLDDVFTPIAHYGAGDVRVATALQDAFAALTGLGDPEMTDAARGMAAASAERALKKLDHPGDAARVRRAVEAVHPSDDA